MLTLTKNITSLLKYQSLPRISKSLSQPLSKKFNIIFEYSINKQTEPRNKQEAWMMQEQQKMKQSSQEEDDSHTYPGLNIVGKIGMVVLIGTLVYLYKYAEEKSDENLDFYTEDISGLRQLKQKKSDIGCDWTLIDSSGKPFSSSMLQGSYYLVFFGLTNCPDHCPSALYYLNTVYRVIRNIPEGAYLKLKLVFVSIDPERDSPKEIKKFIKAFNKKMIGVTGYGENNIELTEMMKKFKVFKKKKMVKRGGKQVEIIDHISNIFLMSPQNDYLDHIQENTSEQQAAKAIVAKIVANQYKKQKQIEKLNE